MYPLPLLRPSALTLATMSLLASLGGCAARQPAGGGGPASGTPTSGAPAGISAAVEPALDELGAVMLHVDNRGWEDMLIFVVRGNLTDRLGRVSSAGRWSVALDKWIDAGTGQIQLVAQPMGHRVYGSGATVRTQVLTLKAGQTVLWTIEKDLSRSFFEVR